jgi:iron complex outermembrane recepter protein
VYPVVLLLQLLLTPTFSLCQLKDSVFNDSLEPVIIHAYEQSRALKDYPAAINFISSKEIQRFNPASLVMAVSATPGIRMEERSPGSYRINIRGSALRSPFGVRNIKIYYNDLPVTDPGGNTFFNQFAPGNINSIEIIKGPGSSIYGSGTGGVMLINSIGAMNNSFVSLQLLNGSNGLQQIDAVIKNSSNHFTSQAGLYYMAAKGHRDHSRIDRKMFSWNGKYMNAGHELSFSFLAGDLKYETPGALTFSEYSFNSRMARPSVGTTPGAVQSNASINQTTFLSGASFMQQLHKKIKNKTAAYAMFTKLVNPSIRNYGKSIEPHAGLRTAFYFDDSLSGAVLNMVLGGEWQKGLPSFETFINNNGNPGNLQWQDEVKNSQQFIFLQGHLTAGEWLLIAGASINKYKAGIQRFSPLPGPELKLLYNNEIATRISISKKFGKGLVYSGVSHGFSPPSLSEISPTGSTINLSLQPEKGINTDLGFKITLDNITIDVNAFQFRLKNTVVQRRDSAGGDYYINAGRTKQTGIETSISLSLFKNKNGTANSGFWLTHSWYNFKYAEFIQLENNYSGNSLPGIPRHTVTAGFDLTLINGCYTHLHYQFNSAIFLNDANTGLAPSYQLAGIRIGYGKKVKKNYFEISSGLENIFNEIYSLGNDINAFGGRYYNAAPLRNYYVAIKWQPDLKNNPAANL